MITLQIYIIILIIAIGIIFILVKPKSKKDETPIIETPITLEELNLLNFDSISDEQISETTKRLELIENTNTLNEIIYFLLDNFYLLPDNSTPDENITKNNENVKKLLSCNKLKEVMKAKIISFEVV